MLSVDKLIDAFDALDPVATELEAVANFATAYASYAQQAQAAGVIISPSSIDVARQAMQTALLGFGQPGAGVAHLYTSLVAFWTAIAANGPLAFAGAVVITPPHHAGFAAALSAVMSQNRSAALSKRVALRALATVFHTHALIGGTVTFPGPAVSPIL